MRPSPLDAVLRRVVTALLLAAGVAFASGSAQATCGDYLTIEGKQHAMPSGPAKPCHGPNCTADPNPTPVPMTAPAPAPSEGKDSAAGLQLVGDHLPPAAGFGRPASDGDSIHVPRSVFHPPRHS
jgi:hypothetical protein